MDALLRRAGFLPLFVIGMVSSLVAGGMTAPRPLWWAFLRLTQVTSFLLALRAAALRGDAERRGQQPPPVAAKVRRVTTSIRVVAALALGSLVWWAMHRVYERWWLSALLSLAVAATVVYAMAPLPPPPQAAD